MDDLYFMLGISKRATDEEIKKAYRDQVKIHHPDKGGDKNIFCKIQLAYDVLSDPERKKKYDQDGSYDERIEANIELKAVEYIVISFDKILNEYIQINLNGVNFMMNQKVVDDVVSRLNSSMLSEIKSLKMNKNSIVKVIDTLEKLRTKIEYKNEDNRNILDKVLDGKLKGAKKDLDISDIKIDTINKAIEIMKNYGMKEIMNKQIGSTLETLFSTSTMYTSTST